MNKAEEFHTKLKAALGQLTCAYCGEPIGYATDDPAYQAMAGWTHHPEDGPDAYVYCGDEYGTEASPVADPVILKEIQEANAAEGKISKEAFTGLWTDLVQPFDAPATAAPAKESQPGSCPKCGQGLTRMYMDGGKNIEWVCTYCRYMDMKNKKGGRMEKLLARTDPDGIKCPVCMLRTDSPVHDKAMLIADEWKKNGKDTAVKLANQILSELKLVRWEQLALGDSVRAHVNDGGKKASCCSECESCAYFSKAASESDTERKQANLRFWNDMKLQHMLEVEPKLRTASAKANYFSLIEHKDGQRIRLGYWPVTSEKTASRLINKLYAEFNRPERYSFYASSDIPAEIEAEPVKEASEITNIEAPIVGTVKNIRPSKHKEGFDILTLEDTEGMTSVVMAPADSYVVGDVIRDDDQPPTQIDGVPVYAASKLIKWKASEPPSGRFRSFSTRAWPSAEYANGDPAVSIYSTDEYRPADAKSGQHAPLTVMIADWGLSPEEKAKRGAFVWRKMKGEFKTLAEAKAAAEKLLAANPQIHSQRPSDLTPQTSDAVNPEKTSSSKAASGKFFDQAGNPLTGQQIDEFIATAYKGLAVLYTGEGLRKEGDGWYVGVDDNNPDVFHWFITYKNTPFGKKIFALGHDGSREAIAEMLMWKQGIMQEEGMYIEASGRIEALCQKWNLPKVPVEKAEKVLVGKPITPEADGFHYSREIQGKPFTKCMFGQPHVASVKTADVGTTPESPEGPMNIAVNNGDAQRPGQAKQPEGYAWEWNGKEAILSCPTGSIVLEGQDCREFTTAMMKLDDSDLNDEQLNEKIGEVIAHFFDAKAMAM